MRVFLLFVLLVGGIQANPWWKRLRTCGSAMSCRSTSVIDVKRPISSVSGFSDSADEFDLDDEYDLDESDPPKRPPYTFTTEEHMADWERRKSNLSPSDVHLIQALYHGSMKDNSRREEFKKYQEMLGINEKNEDEAAEVTEYFNRVPFEKGSLKPKKRKVDASDLLAVAEHSRFMDKSSPGSMSRSRDHKSRRLH